MKLLIVFGLLLVAGCVSQAQCDAVMSLAELLDEGALTQEQFIMLRDALLEGGVGWVQDVIGYGAAAAAAYFGIQAKRGPTATPEERIRRKMAKKQPAVVPAPA
jgi:hypothetical protein